MSPASAPAPRGFSGSYAPEDVEFLLKPITVEPVSVEEKEQRIQSGYAHYSELLSPERLPSVRYLEVFHAACRDNLDRMARDCLSLAALIAARRRGPITLVSLARAGTPVGVVLRRLLAQTFAREVAHFSISIIRDRGIDAVALRHLLARGHAPESLVFVDGWTGKGVISQELARAVSDFNARHAVAIDPGLFVLSDLAGTAACAAGGEDYLIPSSILNATVSGLVSRSVLNAAIGPDDFHGCVHYREFEAHDLSRGFVDALTAAARDRAGEGPASFVTASDRAGLARISGEFMHRIMARHGITDVNLVKPGIGEATRVLLRRVPRLLLLRDPAAAPVAHLRVLAAEKSVPVLAMPELPYQAVSLIGSARDA